MRAEFNLPKPLNPPPSSHNFTGKAEPEERETHLAVLNMVTFRLGVRSEKVQVAQFRAKQSQDYVDRVLVG